MTDVTRTGNPFFDAWMDAGRRFLDARRAVEPDDRHDRRRRDVRRRDPRPGNLGALPAPGRRLGEGVEPLAVVRQPFRRRRRHRRGDAAEDDGPDAVPLRRHRRDQPGDPAAGRGPGVRRHRHHRAPGAEGDGRVDGAARGERRLPRRDVGGLELGRSRPSPRRRRRTRACCSKASGRCSTAGSASPTTN